MNCAKCGQPLDAGATFCGNCGSAVSLAAAAEAPAQMSGEPVTPGGTVVEPAPPAVGKGKLTAAVVLGGLSLAAWIFWPVGLVVSIVGLVLGIIGRRPQHRGMFIAALVLNSIGIILSLLSLAAALSNSG